MRYPRAMSHIGLSVPNLEAAVKFYHDVMGWYIIMHPTKIKKDDKDIIAQFAANQCVKHNINYILIGNL